MTDQVVQEETQEERKSWEIQMAERAYTPVGASKRASGTKTRSSKQKYRMHREQVQRERQWYIDHGYIKPVENAQ